MSEVPSLDQIESAIRDLQSSRSLRLRLDRSRHRNLARLIFGGRNANVSPDSPLLQHTVDELGRSIVMVPVLVNDFAVPGRPIKRPRYENGRPVLGWGNKPIEDTFIPQIVGETFIRASTIEHVKGVTLTGFARLTLSDLTSEEVLEFDNAPAQGSSLVIDSDSGSVPGVVDDTDAITTSGNFTPSETLQ